MIYLAKPRETSAQFKYFTKPYTITRVDVCYEYPRLDIIDRKS